MFWLVMIAVLYPTEGNIRIDGVPVDKEHRWDVRRKVSVAFQDPDTTGDNNAVVAGRLQMRSWETQEGDKRTVVEIEADAVRGFAAGGARGCNVTVPFKFEAFALAARHSVRAALAQAAIYLAMAPKSNAVYRAYLSAAEAAAPDEPPKGALGIIFLIGLLVVFGVFDLIF